jgi:hypothetical protein
LRAPVRWRWAALGPIACMSTSVRIRHSAAAAYAGLLKPRRAPAHPAARGGRPARPRYSLCPASPGGRRSCSRSVAVRRSIRRPREAPGRAASPVPLAIAGRMAIDPPFDRRPRSHNIRNHGLRCDLRAAHLNERAAAGLGARWRALEGAQFALASAKANQRRLCSCARRHRMITAAGLVAIGVPEAMEESCESGAPICGGNLPPLPLALVALATPPS